ncbi:MAG TPA: MGMT family protein [Streptosporangiaceae bacterium]|jgi:O-6-methylguanine DNA methyltransferase
MSDHDDLLTGLAGLSAEPPAGLIDRVAARWVRVPGPIGDVFVASTDAGVAFVRTTDSVHDDAAAFAAAFRDRVVARPLLPGGEPPAGVLPALRTGRTGDIRFDLAELSGFERDVLLAAATIPRGEVRPYGWIAREIGNPKAVRAVGSALGRNPVPLLIPCHRVVRSDGATGQYIFGPAAKLRLLGTEGVDLDALRH